MSLWLSMALQKANQRLENKFEKHWNKASRPNAPRKRVRAQETETVNMDRVVPIAALCVECGSRCILVSMGSYSPASKQAFGEIKYPGVKVKNGESPYDAAARLCKSRLTALSDFIKVETASFDAKEEEDISKRTGLPSRYLRTIFRGHMSPLVPWGDYMTFIPSRASNISMKLTSQHSSLARRFLRAHPRSPPLSPDIFAFKQDVDNSEITLYAWMPSWEFEYLRYTSQGEALVDFWVQQGDYSVLHPDGSVPRCYSPVAWHLFGSELKAGLETQNLLAFDRHLATKLFCGTYLCRAFGTKVCNNRPHQRGVWAPRQNGFLIHSHVCQYSLTKGQQ
ncbi:unnamed protein product [Symbiodinium pilosum]|uniref:Uncharacterized protein n=1 Tax=Symbiodinium pilosum TaxID=2952 RepID=A0A812PV71_SYMPI|nr:unnamed protein product [Symbiodinium pilosum]